MCACARALLWHEPPLTVAINEQPVRVGAGGQRSEGGPVQWIRGQQSPFSLPRNKLASPPHPARQRRPAGPRDRSGVPARPSLAHSRGRLDVGCPRTPSAGCPRRPGSVAATARERTLPSLRMMWPRGLGAGSQEHTRRRGPAFQTEAGKDDWIVSCWLAGNRRDARNRSGMWCTARQTLAAGSQGPKPAPHT